MRLLREGTGVAALLAWAAGAAALALLAGLSLFALVPDFEMRLAMTGGTGGYMESFFRGLGTARRTPAEALRMFSFLVLVVSPLLVMRRRARWTENRARDPRGGVTR